MPKDFAVICNELTYLGQVVLQGTRIVIPEKLWNRVLDLSHEGHQGNVKTKEHLTSKVWWLGLIDTPRSNIESVLTVS